MTPIRIFTPTWGEKHLELFKRALGRSLQWPKNYAALQDVKWMIMSDSDADMDKAASIAKSILPECTIEGMVADDLTIPGVDRGMVLIRGVRAAIKACLKDGRPLLIATPDFIWGNGTIKNFMKIAHEPGTCASIAHIRALPSVLRQLETSDFPPQNAELVQLAWNYPHISWTGGNIDSGEKRDYYGGVLWQKTSFNTAWVQHKMPSPFYCNFLPVDLDHFNEWDAGRPPGFGVIDHLWPSHLVNVWNSTFTKIKPGRMRFIGSSEIATMVEITEASANVPPINPQDKRPGEFAHNKLHNQFFAQMITCMQGMP